MLPVRCFTCNKILGRYEKVFRDYSEANYVEFFEKFGITRYCCRKIFLTHVDVFQDTTEYDPVHNVEIRKTTEIRKFISTG